MQTVSFDPGLTQQYGGSLSRVINKDGKFNVRRTGGTWRDFHPYLFLINLSWPLFLAAVFSAYLLVNTTFAAVYFALGRGALLGADASTASGRFFNDFFFSAHTLSTVGYGSISPHSLGGQIVAAFESLVGVMGFAVATGLLYGRVSRPSARIGFSEKMLMTSYQDGKALQFRIVNRRHNSLMELEAKALLMTVDREDAKLKRSYQLLRLERERIMFLPLTWTLVHPIDEESPLFGKAAEELEQMQAEVLIQIKAYDDTFNQMVQARVSYRHDEIVWGRQFAPAFRVDSDGDLVLEVSKVGELA